MNIIPVILSGGGGSRLWPLSRQSRPKQFLNLSGEHSLFQNTCLRCRNNIFHSRPIIMGSNAHRFLLAEDLREIGVSADIVLEPVSRNSCAAIAVAALHAVKRDPQAVVLVLAADHEINDHNAFVSAVKQGLEDAQDGYLVTFGIIPNHPADSYGYIKPAETLKQAKRVEKFVEKPSRELAQTFVKKGYMWNSGNFLFQARIFLQELEKFEPEILAAATASYNNSQADLDFLRIAEEEFEKSPSVSVDFAVMERTELAAVLPVDYQWSDVGSWDSIHRLLPADNAGNVAIGRAEFSDTTNSFSYSDHRLTTLIGVSNLVVVETRDAVLVVDRDKCEDVKGLVENLKQKGYKEASEALQIFRPWGNYEQLDTDEGYQVKRLTVKPGGVLSLQKHRHRSEHWVVVRGIAEVTIEDNKKLVYPNQAAYIPQGAVHRLANHESEPLVLIEVQTGDYLGEDDIIRLEDNYNRHSDH